MTWLDAYGLAVVVVMLVSYKLESYSYKSTLVFAISCLLMGVYGFLQGSWPIAVLEVIWAGIAAHKWWEDRCAWLWRQYYE